ncbi:Variant-specific surface protein [Giardia duodenalis]|uniref:Variant-specific surface protein n=1 Tax=Giardia intestinalis TaxID=5741 RepID=V6U0J3_GIAIN|nr:Variant-specific surface protein [Giardia intestinalis]
MWRGHSGSRLLWGSAVLGDSAWWTLLLALAAASALVLCGALPARGGCYSISVTGSGVCREARDGACVMYAEELKVGRTGARQGVASGTCTPGTAATNCKADMCNVQIGGETYCSQCNAGAELLIDGTCVTSTTELAKKCITNSQGACTQCGDGYLLHKGGCYQIGGTVGLLICTDTTPSNPVDTAGKCTTCAAGYFKNPTQAAAAVPPCIACNDTAGFTDSNSAIYKGVVNCAECTAPEKGTSSGDKLATCTACVDGYYGSGNPLSCAACDSAANCATCSGAATACTSCKTSETANGKEYFRIKDNAAKTGECVTETDCKTSSTYFPTTDKTNQKKVCTLCNDASNGGIADCKTCTPKTTAGLAETPSVTCSVCTPNTKKPNKAGSKCFNCQVAHCSHCSADGVCEACDNTNKVSPGGSSCVPNCPENSSEQSGACVCNSGFTPSGDKCTSSSANKSALSTGAIAGISVAAVVACPVPLTGYLPLHNEQSKQSYYC